MANPKGNCISISDLNLSELIAEGTFGGVHQTNWSTSTFDEEGNEELCTVAVKCPNGVTKKTMLTERNIKAELWHENIVNILGYAQLNYNQKVALVFEYTEEGTVYDYIWYLREAGIGATAETMMRIALDIARGMEYLHENEYIHGDLALRNCIIDADRNVKVGDLDFYDEDGHEDCYFSNSMNGSMPCPVRWMAPENLPYKYNKKKSHMILQPHAKSYTGDVWAFGVVLYELWTRGEFPFEGCDTDQMVCKLILDGGTAATWDPRIKIRSCMKEIMESCWEFDCSERPSFQSIVSDFEDLMDSDSDEQEDSVLNEDDDSDY